MVTTPRQPPLRHRRARPRDDFAFDALNRLLASTDAEDGVTEYTYDALDHLIRLKDPKGLETTYTYNALGDLLVLDSSDTGTTSYAYDSAGNRVSQRDAKGVEVNYTYDALNGLTGGLNSYAYVGSNPLRWIDPLGLCRVDVRFAQLGPNWYTPT